jgi:hypothetical protein
MRPYLASTKLRSRNRLPPPAAASLVQQQQQQQYALPATAAQAAAAAAVGNGSVPGSGGAAIGSTGSTAASRFMYDLYAVVVHRGTFQAGSSQCRRLWLAHHPAIHRICLLLTALVESQTTPLPVLSPVKPNGAEGVLLYRCAIPC